MKQIIHTDLAPAAIGPYSQAVKVDNIVYTAGQIALDPQTGQLKNSTLEEEMNRVMANLKAILREAGSTFNDVIKATIFVADLELYGEINQLYAKYFEKEPPARSTVEVARLPKDVNVEIDFVAYCP